MQAARQNWMGHFAAGSADQSRPPRKSVHRAVVSVASPEYVSSDSNSSRIELYPELEEIGMEQESQFANRKRAQEVADAITRILNEEVALVTRRLDIKQPVFADMLSKAAGRRITPAMLRNWVSPSQPHQIPLWAFIAWYKVVGNRTTVDKVFSLMGLTTMDKQQAELIGLANKMVEREFQNHEIAVRLGALVGRRESAA